MTEALVPAAAVAQLTSGVARASSAAMVLPGMIVDAGSAAVERYLSSSRGGSRTRGPGWHTRVRRGSFSGGVRAGGFASRRSRCRTTERACRRTCCRTSSGSTAPRSAPRTRPSSTVSSSGPSPRRSARLPPTPATSAPRSASSPCCTPGARRSSTIRICTASSRVGARKRRQRLGFLPPRVLPAGTGPFALLPPCPPRGAARRLRVRTAAVRRPAAALSDPRRFAEHLRPARETEWVVYAKRPFAGPEQVLDYLGRYTHRVAIGNQRLYSLHDGAVRFRYTDYRRAGASRQKTMTLTSTEFIPAHAAPRAPARLPPHSLLRLPRQSHPTAEARRVPALAARAPAATGRARRPRPQPTIGIAMRR